MRSTESDDGGESDPGGVGEYTAAVADRDLTVDDEKRFKLKELDLRKMELASMDYAIGRFQAAGADGKSVPRHIRMVAELLDDIEWAHVGSSGLFH